MNKIVYVVSIDGGPIAAYEFEQKAKQVIDNLRELKCYKESKIEISEVFFVGN
jgi:hypothetical protein